MASARPTKVGVPPKPPRVPRPSGSGRGSSRPSFPGRGPPPRRRRADEETSSGGGRTSRGRSPPFARTPRGDVPLPGMPHFPPHPDMFPYSPGPYPPGMPLFPPGPPIPGIPPYPPGPPIPGIPPFPPGPSIPGMPPFLPGPSIPGMPPFLPGPSIPGLPPFLPDPLAAGMAACLPGFSPFPGVPPFSEAGSPLFGVPGLSPFPGLPPFPMTFSMFPPPSAPAPPAFIPVGGGGSQTVTIPFPIPFPMPMQMPSPAQAPIVIPAPPQPPPPPPPAFVPPPPPPPPPPPQQNQDMALLMSMLRGPAPRRRQSSSSSSSDGKKKKKEKEKERKRKEKEKKEEEKKKAKEKKEEEEKKKKEEEEKKKKEEEEKKKKEEEEKKQKEEEEKKKKEEEEKKRKEEEEKAHEASKLAAGEQAAGEVPQQGVAAVGQPYDNMQQPAEGAAPLDLDYQGQDMGEPMYEGEEQTNRRKYLCIFCCVLIGLAVAAAGALFIFAPHLIDNILGKGKANATTASGESTEQETPTSGGGVPMIGRRHPAPRHIGVHSTRAPDASTIQEGDPNATPRSSIGIAQRDKVLNTKRIFPTAPAKRRPLRLRTSSVPRKPADNGTTDTSQNQQASTETRRGYGKTDSAGHSKSSVFHHHPTKGSKTFRTDDDSADRIFQAELMDAWPSPGTTRGWALVLVHEDSFLDAKVYSGMNRSRSLPVQPQSQAARRAADKSIVTRSGFENDSTGTLTTEFPEALPRTVYGRWGSMAGFLLEEEDTTITTAMPEVLRARRGRFSGEVTLGDFYIPPVPVQDPLEIIFKKVFREAKERAASLY